ncbi:hypothetical protein N9Z18_00570 [Verrucomicrobiales bacterium]|jgi:hypothetical protein|nr:hypothetical protein [Verrucomicrobiales bacterium]MDB4358713.1 hypothetical protein [Verrucomicrobiales bacterium]
MTAIVAAMVVFFVKGKPADPAEEETVIVSTPARESLDKNTTDVKVDLMPMPPVESDFKNEEVVTPDIEATEDELPKTANVVEPMKEKGFTPWMHPLALDTYIRAKSSGNGKSFWESGHWITSVEGR